MNTIEIIEQLLLLLEEVEAENLKTSKAAHGRARKAAGQIKNLAAEFKRTSVAEDKK